MRNKRVSVVVVVLLVFALALAGCAPAPAPVAPAPGPAPAAWLGPNLCCAQDPTDIPYCLLRSALSQPSRILASLDIPIIPFNR